MRNLNDMKMQYVMMHLNINCDILDVVFRTTCEKVRKDGEL